MRKTNLSWVFAYIVLIFGVFLYFSWVSKVSSAATHLVISQIQLRGVGTGTTDNEFIELYNPTNSTVNLAKWNVRRKTAAQTGAGTNLVASLSGTIQAHGYFLIGSPEYAASISADTQYSTTSHIAADNTVLLYSDTTGTTLVDKVGFGTAGDFEASPAANPANGGSIQRKIDDTGGHGMDTDSNLNDFETLAVSAPRNSTVVITPTATMTPTSTPTNTPTSTPTPRDTPTPTLTPSPTPTNTPTPTPTDTPTPTPTDTISPTPTNTPTPTNMLTPTPTNTPTPTASATPTLTPTPTTPPLVNIPVFNLVCTTKNIEFNYLFGTIKFAIPSCKLVKVN